MIFLTKQEKQEYIREQANAEDSIYFTCPVCARKFTTSEATCNCCADFDDEGMLWKQTK